ncbi:MAG: transposase [Bacillota bacterium]|nr:transposase [Bacillota bacterium]
MLDHVRTHEQYLCFMLPRITKLFLEKPGQVLFYLDAALKAYLLNLDRGIEILQGCYSKDFGRPAVFDPVDMLRSLILMVSLKITCVSKWADDLTKSDVLAILCGFEPGKTPSAAAFYDFWNRLWLEDKRLRKKRKLRLRKKSKKPKNVQKGQKLPNRRPGVVDRLVRSFRKGRFFSTKRPERLLQELFTRVFVQGSRDRDIIPVSMILAGDGSPFESCSNPFGIPVCDCRNQGIYRCDCPRRYSDVYANWGYDSSRDVYFWGRNLYTFSCVNGESELPVFLRFGQGSRHDSVLFAFSVVEAWPLFSEAGLNVNVFIGDSAHDANALYALLDDYGSKPVIELKNKPSSLIPLNEQGIPLCPKGFLMQYWGFDEKKSRFKWRCPKVVGKKSNRNKIDCTTPCTNSSYGFSCYTKPEWDRRIFTDIPRGSALWKQLYKRRSVSERVNKRYNDFGLDTARVRENCYWYHLAHLAAMNVHLDAWVKQELKKAGVDKKELLLRFLGISMVTVCA